ncbi:MAG: hypothetical protein ACREKS_14940 [Candidatus Rokuibacteriota bacterium]
MARLERHLLGGASLGVAAVALLLLATEGAIRTYQVAAHGIRFLRVTARDPILGWDADGTFGDPGAPRLKILVVGDSFTALRDGGDVPRMYYSVLGRAIGAEIFAYGGHGYGTLQEALVIERTLRAVQPDRMSGSSRPRGRSSKRSGP